MAGGCRDRRTLSRIAATLLGLALLAERAAVRSFPVRFLVLAILGRAEKIARAYVAREIEADGWCLDEPPASHHGAAGAGILALRLRMLAAVLGILSGADDGCVDGPAGCSAVWAASPYGAPGLPVFLVVRLPAKHFRHAPRPHDTS